MFDAAGEVVLAARGPFASAEPRVVRRSEIDVLGHVSLSCPCSGSPHQPRSGHPTSGFRPAPPTPAAARCRRRRRRSRRAGRRAAHSVRHGHDGEVTGLARRRPRPTDRRRHGAARCRGRSRRPRWCGRERSGCSRRTASPGSRSLRHHVVVTSSGARRSTSRAKASAARRTSVKPWSGRSGRRCASPVHRRSSGTRPRRARRGSRADIGDSPHPIPAAVRHRGRDRCATRPASRRRRDGEFHGWNSTVDICTAQITSPISVTHSSSACRL